MAAYFFDSSALVKLYVSETGTAWVTTLIAPSAGHQIHVASLTSVEVLSAITRRERSGNLPGTSARSARAQFRIDLANRFVTADITSPLIGSAMRLAETHALRGADAVQLAAVLEVGTRLSTLGIVVRLVSADAELSTAAAAEGLAVDDPNLHP